MRFQRRTGQCGLPELLSHSGTHSRSRGQHAVHIRCRCPVGMHSPTAIIRVQQFFPDQLHLCALLPVKLFHPSMVSARRGTSVSFPYKTGGLDVCIIFSFTQFVNRLIPLFSRMYFLHDISACAARIFCTVWQKRSPLPVHCRRILHTKDRVSSAGSDKARPFAVFGLGYRRNHVPERGLAALPLPVIL